MAFLVPDLRIFIFCTKLCNKAISRLVISHMISVFQNCYPKRPNKANSIPYLGVFVFSRNFAVGKTRGY